MFSELNTNIVSTLVPSELNSTDCGCIVLHLMNLFISHLLFRFYIVYAVNNDFMSFLKFFLSEIKNTNSLDNGINRVENIWQYDWHIDTKYYTADIQLCSTPDRTIGNEEFAELVQAVIIYFNPNQVMITISILYMMDFC